MDLTPVRAPPHLTRSHEKYGPHLGGLPGPADRVTRLGGGPHLSGNSNRKQKRVYMTRRGTPPRWGTPSAWSPPPPCEQALNLCL